MRPLPPHKTHGIIHTVKVSQGHIDALAKELKIPDDKKKWLKPGDEIHIVREPRKDEVHTIRDKKAGEG
jgi:hypothetical protein